MAKQPARNRGGRPTALDATALKRICAALKKGNTREDAARAAGVNVATLYRWLQQGRRSARGRYREFCNAVQAAEAACALKNVATVQKAANERKVVTVKETTFTDGTTRRETTTRWEFDWGAAAWWLERRFPEAWGSHAREIREMQKQLAELAKRIKADGSPPTDQKPTAGAGQAAKPAVGGDARGDGV